MHVLTPDIHFYLSAENREVCVPSGWIGCVPQTKGRACNVPTEREDKSETCQTGRLGIKKVSRYDEDVQG